MDEEKGKVIMESNLSEKKRKFLQERYNITRAEEIQNMKIKSVFFILFIVFMFCVLGSLIIMISKVV